MSFDLHGSHITAEIKPHVISGPHVLPVEDGNEEKGWFIWIAVDQPHQWTNSIGKLCTSRHTDFYLRRDGHWHRSVVPDDPWISEVEAKEALAKVAEAINIDLAGQIDLAREHKAQMR